MTTLDARSIQATINATIQNVNAAMESYTFRPNLPPFDDEGAWLLTNAEHVGEDV